MAENLKDYLKLKQQVDDRLNSREYSTGLYKKILDLTFEDDFDKLIGPYMVSKNFTSK